MRNRELYIVAKGIDKCSDLVNIGDINFTMTLARINDEIQNELRIINKGKKTTPDRYNEYVKRKQAIDIKYAIQKEDGTFQLLGDEVLIRNPNEYHRAIDELKEEFKPEIDIVDNITKEFEDFLDMECSKSITKISKKLLPFSINVEQAKLLFPVITD